MQASRPPDLLHCVSVQHTQSADAVMASKSDKTLQAAYAACSFGCVMLHQARLCYHCWVTCATGVSGLQQKSVSSGVQHAEPAESE